MPLPLETECLSLGMNEASFAALSRMIPRHPTLFQVDSPIDEVQLVLTHPDEIRHVLVSGHRNYCKGRTFGNMKLLMGNGLIVQDGEFWRQQRKMMQPLFHERVLRTTSAIMLDEARALLQRWTEKARAGASINATHDISQATLDTLLLALFGEDLPSVRDPDGKNPFRLLTDVSMRDVAFVPKFRALLQHVFRIMDARTRDGRMPPDLLSMLMAARNGEGQPMTPTQLVDEVATLIIAGHETTAGVLAWAWYTLGAHPEVDARVHAEAVALADEVDALTELPELPYVKSVVLETMRLYPPVWLEDRQAIEDDRIGDHQIPAGAELFLPIYFLHRDARFFATPTTFSPERFESYKLDRRYRGRDRLDAPETERRREAAPEHTSFIPFGAGPRRCIGDQFALLNAQIHFGVIARNLRLARVTEHVDLEPKINLRAKQDFEMRPAPR